MYGGRADKNGGGAFKFIVFFSLCYLQTRIYRTTRESPNFKGEKMEKAFQDKLVIMIHFLIQKKDTKNFTMSVKMFPQSGCC